jgi:hypothetical protein
MLSPEMVISAVYLPTERPVLGLMVNEAVSSGGRLSSDSVDSVKLSAFVSDSATVKLPVS